jgi:hypothetical protein
VQDLVVILGVNLNVQVVGEVALSIRSSLELEDVVVVVVVEEEEEENMP